MNGLNFFPVIHVRQKRLQSLVGNVPDWARLEALVLQYRYLGKVMSDIHADTFHFLDGSIAIFCIGKTDNDREQREVIAFRLTFQYIRICEMLLTSQYFWFELYEVLNVKPHKRRFLFPFFVINDTFRE